VNPREIKRPILVESQPERFKKIVGIIYRRGWSVPDSASDEAFKIDDPAGVLSTLEQSRGLAQVVGQSAEPIALNGQYLILADSISDIGTLMAYDGRPVVVDVEGRILFKRLRLSNKTRPIVLESLDSAGRHPPVVITVTEAKLLGTKLKFSPVLGVLFDSTKTKSKT